jgi:hypothetical protein
MPYCRIDLLRSWYNLHTPLLVLWAGHVRNKTETPDEKRPLWRPRRRREDSIKIDLKELSEGVD